MKALKFIFNTLAAIFLAALCIGGQIAILAAGVILALLVLGVLGVAIATELALNKLTAKPLLTAEEIDRQIAKGVADAEKKMLGI